jgi:PAS domain S-box-containing protein
MRRIFLTTLFISLQLLLPGFSFSTSKAQTGDKKSDAHRNGRYNVAREHREIDSLNILSNKYADSLPVSSFDYAAEALRLARQTGYRNGEAGALMNLGMLSYNKNDFLKAFNNYSAAIELAAKLKNDSLTRMGNYRMAEIFHDLGELDRSVDYLMKAIKYDIKRGSPEYLAGTYLRLGDYRFEQGDTNGALRLYFNALALKPKLANPTMKPWISKSIARFYLLTKRIDIALYYYREALKDNPNDIGYLNGSIMTSIAYCYEQKKEPDHALYFEKLALQIREKEKIPSLIASSMLNIGKTWLMLKNYDSSMFYLREGIKRIELLKMNHYLAVGYRDLYALYVAKNDWKNALIAIQEYNHAEELSNAGKNSEEVTMLETKRIISEKERQVEKLREENFIQRLEMKNRNLVLLLLFLLLILIIITAFSIHRRMIRHRNEKRMALEKSHQLQDEIKEHVLRHKKMAKTEEQYRFIADNVADMITLVDANFTCLYASSSCKQFFGYSPEELEGKVKIRDFIHPESRKTFAADMDRMLKYREATKFLYHQLVRKDGSTIWVEINVNPIFDSKTGKLQAVLSITRDVSNKVEQERSLMEEKRQQETLIREVHHRVKNNLAILASLVNMQKTDIRDHTTLDIFSNLQFRIKAMSIVHEEVYKSREIEVLSIADYLSKLVSIVSSAFTDFRVKVHQNFQDEEVNVETTLPIGLIVNELLTNAFKYAFPYKQEGNIWVSWEKMDGKDDPGVKFRCLTVKDDGVGLPAGFDISKNTTMGSQIITLLVSQIGGKLMTNGVQGASFAIIFPLKK